MLMSKLAVCPGSFDPITLGHLDIIRRAAPLFDKMVVLALNNPEKNYSFSIEERVDFIKRVTSDIPNVEVDSYDGLLADYVKSHDAKAIVKGLRAVSDFEYEFQMALINKKLTPNTETVFLTTGLEHMYLSSSIVKHIAIFGGDISDFLPTEILSEIKARLCKH